MCVEPDDVDNVAGLPNWPLPESFFKCMSCVISSRVGAVCGVPVSVNWTLQAEAPVVAQSTVKLAGWRDALAGCTFRSSSAP